MLQQVKLSTGELVNNPRFRAALILATILIAALAGGAPNDYGG